MTGTIASLAVVLFIGFLILPAYFESITISRIIAIIIGLGFTVGFPAGIGHYRLSHSPRKLSKESLQYAACCAIIVFISVIIQYLVLAVSTSLISIVEFSFLAAVIAVFFYYLPPGMFNDNPQFIDSITDQNKLSEFVLFDAREKIRYAAIQKITDKELFTKIATARKGSISLLTSKAVEDERIRCIAISKIDDTLLLSTLFNTAREQAIRNAAENRLKKLSQEQSCCIQLF